MLTFTVIPWKPFGGSKKLTVAIIAIFQILASLDLHVAALIDGLDVPNDRSRRYAFDWFIRKQFQIRSSDIADQIIAVFGIFRAAFLQSSKQQGFNLD